MSFRPLHQHLRDLHLFGLLPSRFLRETPPDLRPVVGDPFDTSLAAPGHKIPDDVVGKAEKQKIKEFKDASVEIAEFISGYNIAYGKAPEPKDAKDETVYQEIKLNYSDPSAMEKQIREIDQILIEKAGGNSPQALAILAQNRQHRILTKMLTQVAKFKNAPKVGEEAEEQAHRARLTSRHEAMMKAGETHEAWEKNKANYDDVKNAFDAVASSPEFKDAWQAPDGLTGTNQREAKELFFAIMAEKTDGFKGNFVLGKNFTNDFEQNIQNFPFIYNEFLKIEGKTEPVTLEDITRATFLARQADAKVAAPMLTAEEIVINNQSAGLDPKKLPPKPNVPDTKGWAERKAALNRMAYTLELKCVDAPKNDPRVPGWTSAAQNLRAHYDHADAWLHLSSLQEREKKVRSKFTAQELSSAPRRRMVMELAMKQFMKAREIVDHPLNVNWQGSLHPTVRRMMIASIYDAGVAASTVDETTGLPHYDDSVKGEHLWMTSNLILSDYFNQKEEGKAMDDDHVAVLKAAYLGSRISTLLNRSKQTEKLLKTWIDILAENKIATTPEAKEKLFREKMSTYSQTAIAKYIKYTSQEALDALGVLQADKLRLEQFLADTQAAIKDPYSQKSLEFIKEMKKKDGKYEAALGPDIESIGKMGIIDGETLTAYQAQMVHLQLNFNSAELQDKSSLKFFEGLGMHIEGIERPYLEAIKKDPGLKTEYWDKLLLGSDEEFAKLRKLFETILPPDVAGGKEDFLVSLNTLHKRHKGEQDLTRIKPNFAQGNEDAAIFNVFTMLKIHLTGRAETGANEDILKAEGNLKQKGLHISDKISKYVGGVWDMLVGPGQSPANRAAGFILMYGAYKSIQMAKDANTPAGKTLRALFVAGAVEIAVKRITGRGVLDRAGLDSVTTAMQGTYEAVLVENGKKHMEDKEVNPDAHMAALLALNEVPFDQVMTWYEGSDPNGESIDKSKDLLPGKLRNKLGVIAQNAGKGWKETKPDKIARRVLYNTVKHFFGYVGAKDNKQGAFHGREALKERWITMVNNPNYKPKYTPYTHAEALKAGNIKKDMVTWSLVMQAEISQEEVELTKNKDPISKLTKGAEELAMNVNEAVREYIYNPGAGYAEDFFNNCGEAKQDMVKMLGEAADWTKRKIYFGKENAILWFEDNQYEIRRTAENHWELLVTGVKLPFQVIYTVDNGVIPFTLAKLKGVAQILSDRKESKQSTDLKGTDIADDLTAMGSRDTTTNPKFSYYGVYQEDFLNALTKNNKDRVNPKPGPWFYKNPETNVGYFISNVDYKKAHIREDDPSQTEAVREKLMNIESKKQAVQAFVNAGMTLPEIEDMMYEIHVIDKTTPPARKHVFYRMPLRDSAEFKLKSTEKWADYMDPARYKDRAAYEYDPSHTSFENLQKLFLLGAGAETLRVIGSTVGGAAAQIPRFSFGVVEVTGDVIKLIGKKFSWGRTPQFETAVNNITKRPEGHRQMMDEMFTSAKSPSTALSDFYRNPVNAKLYNFSMEFAQKNGLPMFVSILPPHDTTFYSAVPGDPTKIYTNMWFHYRDFVERKRPDPDIERALTATGVAKPY